MSKNFRKFLDSNMLLGYFTWLFDSSSIVLGQKNPHKNIMLKCWEIRLHLHLRRKYPTGCGFKPWELGPRKKTLLTTVFINKIIPWRFRKAGRALCSGAKEAPKPRVTIGWLLLVRDILSNLPAFQYLDYRIRSNSNWYTELHLIQHLSQINVSSYF